MTDRLTPDEATDRMKALTETYDTEVAHWKADEILLQIAKEAGFRGAVNAYSEIDKWYA